MENLPEGFVLLAAIDFGIQISLGFVAIAFSTEKFYDLCGGTTFTILAITALCLRQDALLSTISWRQWGNITMVGIWATRLSCFLFWRILKSGEDRRFRQAKKNALLFLSYWWMQGLWVFLTGLPVYITNLRNSDNNIIDAYMVAGWALFAYGFIFETTADIQKTIWRADPHNRGKWIAVGLWSRCQHPNYAGEILLWVGVYVANVSSYEGWEHIGLVSPVFTFLLLRFISGVPLLQEYALKKWGDNPAWRKYHSSTPLLLFSLKGGN